MLNSLFTVMQSLVNFLKIVSKRWETLMNFDSNLCFTFLPLLKISHANFFETSFIGTVALFRGYFMASLPENIVRSCYQGKTTFP